jgi:hypothetical protein
MYPEMMVIPMREELTRVGIKETKTAAEVDAALAKPGTTLLVVNSICGCAAGKMRQYRSRSGHHRIRRTGPRRYRSRPLLLRWKPAHFACRGDSPRRQAGLSYAAFRD